MHFTQELMQEFILKEAYSPTASWQKLGTKMPNMMVTDLEIQDKTGLLFCLYFWEEYVVL